MRNDPYACMIFAAGLGTRMAPLTDDRPKPLIEVAGQTLLDRALRPAREAGLGPIVVNAHYKSEQIEAALRDEDVTVCVETHELLDTGGGLKAALPHLGSGPVMTMNSDAVWDGPNPFEVLKAAYDGRFEALLLCVPIERALGRTDRGDFQIAENGDLSRGPGYVYTGAQVLNVDRVSARPERIFSLNQIWDELLATEQLGIAIYPGRWCDVGRPASIALAEEMLSVS